MKPQTPPLWIATTLLAVSLLALGIAGPERVARAQSAAPGAAADAAEAPRPAMTVTVATPKQSRLPLTVSAHGNIVAWQEASVGALAHGLQLRDVRVNVGDRVKRGQVLATFGPETLAAELAQAEAAVAEADASRAGAEADWARAKGLAGTGALSAQQMAQYETAAKTAAARLQAAQANVRVVQVRLAQTRVIAMDDGIISARSATVGAVVAGGTELFRLIRQGRLEWRAEVTSAQIARMAPGLKVTLNAANGENTEGTVRMVAPTVDPATRLALVYVDLPASARVAAGMFAKGNFFLGESNGLTIPQSSVVLRDGFSNVFTIEAGNKVAQRRVILGRRVGDQVEVLSGLSASQTVAAMGAGFLADGDVVRVAAIPPASAASPAAPTSAANATAGAASLSQRATR